MVEKFFDMSSCIPATLSCKVKVQERFKEMERQVKAVQCEVQAIRDEEETKDQRNEESLEALEALIAEAGQESSRRQQAQDQTNAEDIKQASMEGAGDVEETR